MNEIDKYHEMMQSLKDNYSHYDEVDNTNEIDIWKINDLVICINNNFIETEPSHGAKKGLSFGYLYKITETPENDMIKIKNDDGEIVPYFIWRFYKLINNTSFIID